MGKQSWELVPLHELPIQIVDGDRSAKYPKRDEFQTEGVVFLNSTNIVDNCLSLSECNRIPEEKYEAIRKGRTKHLDIVMTTRGSIGKVALVKQRILHRGLINAQMLLIRANAKSIDPTFLFYVMRGDRFQGELRNFASGSAQPQIPITDLRQVSVPVPPLPTQRKIAAILSAYDDLIENNLRRIKILEEMAQNLYREWFVKFRFPGHQHARFVDSPLGMIPAGWEVKALGDVAAINARSIKQGNEPQQINYVNISSVSTGHIDQIEPMNFADAPGRARRIVKHGDIIWSTVRPNRKSYCIIYNPQPDLIVSTGFAVISAKEVLYTYLYYAVTTDDFTNYLVNNATGSAYPAVNTEDFEKAIILLPPREVVIQFHEVVGDMFAQKHNLSAKNTTLRRTRDLLLPRLISGEVDVAALDIAMPEEVGV